MHKDGKQYLKDKIKQNIAVLLELKRMTLYVLVNIQNTLMTRKIAVVLNILL